jgi:hypothetical protein
MCSVRVASDEHRQEPDLITEAIQHQHYSVQRQRGGQSKITEILAIEKRLLLSCRSSQAASALCFMLQILSPCHMTVLVWTIFASGL